MITPVQQGVAMLRQKLKRVGEKTTKGVGVMSGNKNRNPIIKNYSMRD